MKTTILIIILFSLTCISSSQKLKDSEVPAAVKTSFTTMYPNSTIVEWEMENKKYEAEFRANSVESSAIFEANGTYVQTETEIPVLSLPAAVSEYISKILPGKKIKEAEMITGANGVVTYEAEVEDNDYIFDSNGIFISKSSDNDDDDK